MAKNYEKNTHYSKGQTPATLNRWADTKAQAIINRYNNASPKDRKPPLFCYTGMSGTSHAVALSLALQRLAPRFHFGMAYVRKDGEKSHGREIERNYTGNIERYEAIFVDDFVCGGETLRRVRSKIGEFSKLNINVACLYNSRFKYGTKELKSLNVSVIGNR